MLSKNAHFMQLAGAEPCGRISSALTAAHDTGVTTVATFVDPWSQSMESAINIFITIVQHQVLQDIFSLH